MSRISGQKIGTYERLIIAYKSGGNSESSLKGGGGWLGLKLAIGHE